MAKASGRRGTNMRKKGRKASRKTGRKASRKAGRKGSRKTGRKAGRSYKKRCWNGGAQTVFPATVNDTSMHSPSKLNHAQGQEYESLHAGQHGGAAVSLASAAPPGYTGMLDDSLRATARIGVLDESMQAIQGMSDQSGGGRRRGSRRKTRGVSRRGSRRKTRGVSRRGSRRGRGSRRKMRGGSALANAQDVGAPGMLLSPSQQAQALQGMNPEWKLATDPGAFKPAGM